MKSSLLLIICYAPLPVISQVIIGKPWTIECGTSTINAFKTAGSVNIRYISPRFHWSSYELTEEEEKTPEKFRNTRLMLEIIYTPAFKVFCTGFNVQSRFLQYKRINLDLVGGVKFFIVPGPDFAAIPLLKSGRNLWYMNLGLLCQLNLGIVAPFVEIGGDRILTMGTEVNFHRVYRKPKNRYRLRLPKS